MTQEDLSELAAVNAKYLGEVELGKTNPTIVFLLKLSWAMGMGMVDLFSPPQSSTEGRTSHAEIIGLLTKLDSADLHKLHKILEVIVEHGKVV